MTTAWLNKLEERLKARAAARTVDPWRLRLERVRGKVGDDGIERIGTQTLFDHLEILQRSRGAGASRRLAKIMRDLGWVPVRVRDLTCGGYLEQVRGYCRDARCRSNLKGTKVGSTPVSSQLTNQSGQQGEGCHVQRV